MSKKEPTPSKRPIACTLLPAELRARSRELRAGLFAEAQASEAILGGLRCRFGARPGLIQELAAVIEAEHRCCPFLRFVLKVEPGDGEVWLELTGAEGTEDFLSALLGKPCYDEPTGPGCA